MSLDNLLDELEKNNISLSLKDGALVATAPKNSITSELKSLIARYRADIISTLEKEGGSLSKSRGVRFDLAVPPNRIVVGGKRITPDMLPLIDLSQGEIDRIVAQTPGGIENIQDIYALSSAQAGILFHHRLAKKGDPYLQTLLLAFADRDLLERYLRAVQQVVDRQDTLRTAFYWEGLSTSAQVVLRTAALTVRELSLDPADGPIAEQLSRRYDPHQYRIELSQAPLLQIVIANDVDNNRWVLLQLLHHLIDDNSSLTIMQAEVQAILAGHGQDLPAAIPFRNLIAQSRLGVSQDEHIRFFTEQLVGVSEPTLPFGLGEVHRDGSQVVETERMLAQALNMRLRNQAKRLGVSLASLCHLAWALVLARTSGQSQVVFGTVMFGRMNSQTNANRAMGLFINTLPLRLDIDATDVEQSVRATQIKLSELVVHEHASLALAQRCCAIPKGVPLFSALLNYRHNLIAPPTQTQNPGIQFLGVQERTNYPFNFTVDDLGHDLKLIAQVVAPLDPDRICGYMQQALESLAVALEHAPRTPVCRLEVLPAEERTLLLRAWNATELAYPDQACIHQLFEQQVERSPDAAAVVFEDQQLSYVQLNARANQLAHQLIERGVVPDSRVAICVERSIAMVVGLLAVLKAGGAYVPLDPAYPSERLTQILHDAAPTIVLADQVGLEALGSAAVANLTAIDPGAVSDRSEENPHVPTLTSKHLAYVIYTSGSTGVPKGVMIEHRNAVNFLVWALQAFDSRELAETLFSTSINFDLSIFECFAPLLRGTTVYVVQNLIALADRSKRVSLINTVPSAIKSLVEAKGTPDSILTINVAGEPLKVPLIEGIFANTPIERLCNLYGPSETTTYSTWIQIRRNEQAIESIGRPVGNTQIYLLDVHREPVPLGAIGEIYIGGAGVARGYLNRAELTAERFVPDPFSSTAGTKMYKTGDLARYLPDGNIIFLGRNDHQVKIRGFRIEPGEIQTRLCEHPQVNDAVVVVREATPGDKRLVAYVTCVEPGIAADIATSLRSFLAELLPEYMIPTAFVPLDAFPLTPNGKLDRSALPAPEDGAFARRAYEPPVDSLETTLAAIWSELLGIQRVGRHDNFFELGGDSLLAMRLIAEINREFGKRLSLSAVFTMPSLATMAVSLLVDGDNGGLLIVPLRAEGSREPIFAVPGAGGGVLVFRELAKALGDDQPFYGIQTIGMDGQELPTSVEETARANIAALKVARPQGPYRLLGHSYGGVIIYEMTRQLQSMGEDVSCLLLLDSNPRPPPMTTDRSLLADICALLTRANRLESRLEMGSWDQLSDEECTQRVVVFLNQNGVKIDLDQFSDFYRVCKVHLHCYCTYEYAPLARPTKGILIRAERQVEDVAMVREMGKVKGGIVSGDYGWGEWLQSPVTIHGVDADHLSMLDDEYVAQYADFLNRPVQ